MSGSSSCLWRRKLILISLISITIFGSLGTIGSAQTKSGNITCRICEIIKFYEAWQPQADRNTTRGSPGKILRSKSDRTKQRYGHPTFVLALCYDTSIVESNALFLLLALAWRGFLSAALLGLGRITEGKGG